MVSKEGHNARSLEAFRPDRWDVDGTRGLNAKIELMAVSVGPGN
jgi:hypothetical protein